MKESWEDLKKNISINPQGNRVRFIPIVPNYTNNSNVLSPLTPSHNLLFKRFIPKHITICPSKGNNNTIKYSNDNENKSIMSVAQTETPHYPAKFNVNDCKSGSLQLSQKQHEVKKLISSTSFVEKCDMNLLKNNLYKVPLSTIWTNDNSNNFESSKNNAFGKPFSSSISCLSQTIQGTSYGVKPKIQTKNLQILPPNTKNTINNSRYFKSSYSLFTSPGHNLYPKAENTSFFTSETENASSCAFGQNTNILEQPNPLSCINKSFNIDDIWKNNQFQPPRM